jgi:hypothetical protein
MRYRVRTPEGELEYPSLKDVEQAYVAGLVGPEDEVLEEGGTLWRKAANIPGLARAQAHRPHLRAHRRGQEWTLVIALGLGVLALLLVARGQSLFALLLGLAVASLLWRVTYHAFRRTPPR